jgi:hypothetical protein
MARWLEGMRRKIESSATLGDRLPQFHLNIAPADPSRCGRGPRASPTHRFSIRIFTDAMSSPSEVAAYRALLASTEAVKTIEKSSANPGPALTVLKIPKQ